jgi:demethylmenaquinone methyltransferase/2-methoxy-6-polyprenyl-1,4-benzoquinol methylase
MANGIQKLYAKVARRYEVINHLLTFGMDIYCRRKAARIAVRDGGTSWLDICCGTGEMAAALRRLSYGDCNILAADFSLPMLKVALSKPEGRNIGFVGTDAIKLPFRDGSFDLVTISFATRNLNKDRTEILSYFTEFLRILKPGGRFVNLETSQPPRRWLRKLMHMYVNLTVSRVGRVVSDSKYGYNYLARTIPRFYDADELAIILREAGFSEVRFKRMFKGVAAIHKAIK